MSKPSEESTVVDFIGIMWGPTLGTKSQQVSGNRLPLSVLGGISAFGKSDWIEIEITVDSGACETVMPMSLYRGISVLTSRQQLEGVEYEVANGAVVHNLGERRFIMRLSPKTNELELCCQVVESVQKPLLAVSSVTAQGHQVVFARGHSHILLSNGEKLPMRNENGVYDIDIWVKSTGFSRQSDE